MTDRVLDAAARILSDDGTWTKGDARICAEFVLAAQADFKTRVEEAREALDAGSEATSDYLAGREQLKQAAQHLVSEIEDWVYVYATGGCSEGQMIDAIVAAKNELRDGALGRAGEQL